MQRSKEGLCVWKFLYFFKFSSPARATGSRCARPPAPRQPCPLPAAFPGKRGRRGGGQPRIPRKPRFPRAPFLWLCSGSFPARQRGERPPPAGPPGEHLERPRRKHLERPRRIPPGRGWRLLPPALPGPAARPPREGKEGGEGAARAAQVRAARRPRSRLREGPGWRQDGRRRGRAGGCRISPAERTNNPCLPRIDPRGALLRWKARTGFLNQQWFSRRLMVFECEHCGPFRSSELSASCARGFAAEVLDPWTKGRLSVRLSSKFTTWFFFFSLPLGCVERRCTSKLEFPGKIKRI